ncbi:MAG: HAD-IIIA family hydrolase [Candidatus Manganitrophaceae bacterium]
MMEDDAAEYGFRSASAFRVYLQAFPGGHNHSQKMRVEGIFFDAGDTLFEVKGSVGVHYSRFAKEYGVTVDPEFLNRRFKEAFQKSPPLAFPGIGRLALKEAERQWWYHLVRSVFEPILFPRFDSFFDDLFHFFEKPDGWSLFPETMEVLDRLYSKGYSLGVISNFDSRLEGVLRSLNLLHFFKTLTFSSREGVAKPSPEIFKRALKEGQLSPGESIYVGDSPHHDIEGAQAVGMKVFLVDRKGVVPEREGVPRLRSLRELFDYI